MLIPFVANTASVEAKVGADRLYALLARHARTRIHTTLNAYKVEKVGIERKGFTSNVIWGANR
jgi:hypothetical protein